MKKYLLFVAILFANGKLFAQQFNVEEFNKNLGKKGTLCDVVKSLRIVNDTLTLLNMGDVYPRQHYTIVIRGNKINLDWTKITGKTVCATGVFEIYKNQPQIAVADPLLINVNER